MFGKLENGNLTYAPINFKLENGGIIVNFNKNIDLMKKYGYKEIIDIQPSYDMSTHYLTIEGYTETDTEIIVNYAINEIVINNTPPLEEQFKSYVITQNRMQLASTYSADSVTFKVDYALCSAETEEYNEDLYNLILNNILVGKDNYNYDKMFTMILDYASWNQISWEQFDILVGLMDMQHNPPIEEIPTDDEIIEEIPNEIM